MSSPVDILALAKNRNIRIYHLDFEYVDGIVARYNGKPRIAVNSRLDERASRFTVAHEMAHLEDDTVDCAYSLIAERRANRMAREMLVPHDRLRAAMDDGHTEYSVLAAIFGVSESVIECRCKEIFNF